MKSLFTIIFCLIMCSYLVAQNNLSHQLISNGGTAFSTPSVHLSVSIGEPVVDFGTTATGHLSQGYQQGFNQSVLSAELIDFQAIRVSNDSVQLHFKKNDFQKSTTVSVQKSDDGKTFLDLKLTLPQTDFGQISDANSVPFPTYYRLKMTAADGKITYSQIRVVVAAFFGFKLSPNPTSDVLNIVFEKIPPSVFIQISDANSRILKTQYFAKASESLPISVSELPTGVYFCRLNDLPTVLKFFKN